jgi:hypothetical protein
MTRKREGKYSLRKHSGGVMHFAVVLVSLEETENGPMVELGGNEFAWLKDEYGPDAWEWGCCDQFRAGALRGARYALDHVADRTGFESLLVSITTIHATVVDTTESDVAYAACHATWDALGQTGVDPPELA